MKYIYLIYMRILSKKEKKIISLVLILIVGLLSFEFYVNVNKKEGFDLFKKRKKRKKKEKKKTKETLNNLQILTYRFPICLVECFHSNG